MTISFCLKSQAVRRLLSVIMICTLLPGSFAWGVNQPPLSRIPVPVPRSNTELALAQYSGPNGLAYFVKDVPAAVRLGKALFWDMQVGSDGVTACASCHYRAGADPVAGTSPKLTARRDKNQLHPGPDTIFGNNSTVIKTFVTVEKVDPVTRFLTPVDVPVILRATGFPLDPNFPEGASRFAPNYSLNTTLDPIPNTLGPSDFPFFLLVPTTARLVIDPLTGLTEDAVLVLRDTNDVVGSQGVKLADFLAINNSPQDSGTPLVDQVFHTSPAPNEDPINNVRQVTGRNSPSVINAVFNYTNFWDGRANNIFNGENPFGPLDQNAGIWIDDGTALVKQKIAIPNSSLASQAVGPALSDVEMSFKGRTFPELGKKMLSLTRPLGQQLVHPNDSVFSSVFNNLSSVSRATLQPDGTVTGDRGLNTDYRKMIEAAFQDSLWISSKKVTLPTKASPNGEEFTQMESNFSLFWGLAIQLYEATLVSDRTPFDRFQLGNKNALGPDLLNVPSAVRGFSDFDSKCTICHSGSEFSSAVVGSNKCLATTSVIDCNRVAFTNNSTHSLIKQDVNPEFGAPPPGLIDAGFFNIGVRPTADDPGRGDNAPSGLPLSFTRLAVQPGLPFVTPKLPLPLPDKVQGSFKTPGLRNVELSAPYFHNGDALTLDQVVEFYTRGGNFPGNPELAAAMQPIGNLRQDAVRRGDIVAFLKKLTDERVRNETAPFDHPELMIPNGIDAITGDEIIITLPATGGADPDVPITILTIDKITTPTDLTTPVTLPTNLTNLVISGTVDDSATVAVNVTNTTPEPDVILPTAFATVGGTVGGVVGGVALPPTNWSINLTGLKPGLHIITVTATSITGSPMTKITNIQITPTAIISGAPLGGSTKQNLAILTIGGNGVVSYQYSLDGSGFNGTDIPVAQKLKLPVLADTVLADGTHSIAVVGKDAGGNQQPIASATTATWFVKANPPVLTLNATSSPTGSSIQTISGTVDLGSNPTISVDTGAKVGPVRKISDFGIATWSCDITGLVAGVNSITVTALDFVFNVTTVKGVITRILPDGNIVDTRILPDGSIEKDGVVDISDALKALRIAVELEQPTVTDKLHGDIAPLVDGKPTQNNAIDIADALLILRKTVGLVTF